MQWSDVTRPPSRKVLRQFAGLLLAFLVGLAAWRWWSGGVDLWVWTLAAAGFGLGVGGLVWPPTVRAIFTTWLILAFPIGWTVSRVLLAVVFYLLITPLAAVFRLLRRDALTLRHSRRTSYWTKKPGAIEARQYFRQF